MTAGSIVLLGVFGVIVRAEPALHTVTMGFGALAWAVGNGCWLAGYELPQVVSLWMSFLVLTIAGERLELSRFLTVSVDGRVTFVVVLALLCAGLGAGGVGAAIGARVTGVALVALTVWLLRHDIARRTVRQSGLPRFTAVCLLSGYAWLGIGGLCTLWFGQVVAGPQYDAVLHAVFVGFVFAMIFGHAPIIFPAVLGMAVPFRPVFYAHLAVLHLSLLVRVLGDLIPSVAVRQWGGMLNAAAVVLFLINTVLAVLRGRRLSHSPLAAGGALTVPTPSSRKSYDHFAEPPQPTAGRVE